MKFPVFWISVAGFSLNSYGTSPNLRVQKELVKFRQCTQDTWLLLLNSLEIFLVTLPSISSETWEMYSWVNSGSSTVCPLLLLLPSGVSLETAANFLLFVNVAILLQGKSCQRWRLNLSFLVLIKVSSKSEGIKFQQYKQSKKVIFRELSYSKSQYFIKLQYRTVTIYIKIFVLLVLLFIRFLGGKHNCLHARSRYK